jgi:pyruvate ferredoxin oxidoreductase gamma subunit
MGFPRLESIKIAFETQLGKAVEENFAATKEAYETALVIPPEVVDKSATPKGIIMAWPRWAGHRHRYVHCGECRHS